MKVLCRRCGQVETERRDGFCWDCWNDYVIFLADSRRAMDEEFEQGLEEWLERTGRNRCPYCDE